MNKVLSLLFLILLAACSTVDKTTYESSTELNYTAVYMVHGDANYTYHEDGKRYKADEKVIEEAITRGKTSKRGEIFIFHQKPERKRFLFFQGKDREWYHYRGGKLVGRGSYSPKGGGFTAEAELYKERASKEGRKLFLYFGHEIPSKASFSYHNSRPKHLYNTEIFARDLAMFENKFDMVLLSTCNNGNPYMASKLTDRSKYLVASPRDLHLSYIDTHALVLLEDNPSVSTQKLADSVAKSSFEELNKDLQTLITVGVYDLSVVDTYIDTFAGEYISYLENHEQRSLFRDNTDCRNLEIYTSQNIPEKGTKLYFSSPAFGREANLETHSVWGCKE
jgi:hypothetical protein